MNPSFWPKWRISWVLWFLTIPARSIMPYRISFRVWSSWGICHCCWQGCSPGSLLVCRFGSGCFRRLCCIPLGLLLMMIDLFYAELLFLLWKLAVLERLFLALILLARRLGFLILVFVRCLLEINGCFIFHLGFRFFVEGLRLGSHQDLLLLLYMPLIENLIQLALQFPLKFLNNLISTNSYLINLKINWHIFKIIHLKI